MCSYLLENDKDIPCTASQFSDPVNNLSWVCCYLIFCYLCDDINRLPHRPLIYRAVGAPGDQGHAAPQILALSDGKHFRSKELYISLTPCAPLRIFWPFAGTDLCLDVVSRAKLSRRGMTQGIQKLRWHARLTFNSMYVLEHFLRVENFC